MAKLLIVEDDVHTSHVLQDWLKHQNYQIETTADGLEARHFLSAYAYDLIILDWELPGCTGIEVLRSFRQKGGKTPVLFLTGQNSTDAKEQGLDTGADDYLAKPVDLRELSARVRALLRRSNTVVSNEVRHGNLVLDQAKRVISLDGQALTLSPTEFAVLEYFMLHPNQLISNEVLLDSVWKADAPGTNASVRALLLRLRKKIDQEGHPGKIESVYGMGYRFLSETTT